jgi:acetylglutamate kinase
MSRESIDRQRMPFIVVKLGGEAAGDPSVVDAILEDIAALMAEGMRVVLLHGGGAQATALATRLGIPKRIVGGRRITDPETLEIMKMTLAGQVRVDLLARCRARALSAVGVDGVADDVIQARRRPPRVVSGCGDAPIDFGEVGDVVAIGTDVIRLLATEGYLPIVNSLGADEDGRVLNINADIVATRMAAALGAKHLFLLTGAPGVLGDLDNPETRIPRLTIDSAKEAIARGIIQGGMIPKLEESFFALNAGVNTVHILSAEAPNGLQRSVRSAQDPGLTGPGTTLTA